MRLPTLLQPASEMLLRQSPGCTWLLRRDLQFESVYGETAGVFGRPESALLSSNFADLFPAAAREVWRERVDRVFTGESVSTAARFAEGAPPFSITLFPVRRQGGEVAYAGGAAHEMLERELLLRTLQAVEAERARVARFLHDHVGQDLSAAGLQLDLLRMDLSPNAAAHAQRAADIQGTLEAVIHAVRQFRSEWNPIAAEELGLRAALDMLAGSLRAEFAGNIRVWADAHVKPAPAHAAALYRIAQEAAANAVRHAGCTVIEILLKSMRRGPALEVRDNGRGFDLPSAAREAGMGILAMQYEAERSGMELSIESSPGKGTLVRAVCSAAASRAGGH